MHESYIVAAIPLNRPEIRRFLLQNPPRVGQPVTILDQRPTPQARLQWASALRQKPDPTTFLTIHDPHCHVMSTTTGRLVPRHLLSDPGYLSRNMGGWSPLYFAVMGRPTQTSGDPLLEKLVVLTEYGPVIKDVGPDESVTAGRLEAETGMAMPDVVGASLALATLRNDGDLKQEGWLSLARLAQRVQGLLDPSGAPATIEGRPVPQLLLLDQLLDTLARVEAARRTAEATADTATDEAIQGWQDRLREETGVQVILKGEYIMGRHRRSTILLVPSSGVVVKQPGLEPLHEVQLGAVTYAGALENWPVLTDGGALVTAAGRIRLTVEEGLVPRLSAICGHDILFSTLLGLSIEKLVPGPTFQEYVLQAPQRLSADWYEEIVLHQQVAELLGIENGDWHSANFILHDGEGPLVHIDWGAARRLRAGEMTAESIRSRFDQVRNIAYSFHSEPIASHVTRLHDQLAADPERLQAVRRRAQAMIDDAGTEEAGR